MRVLGPSAPPGPVVTGGQVPGLEEPRGPATSGWPLTALLMLYPLWWALGMGTLILFVLPVPMVVHLWRSRPIATPPGFGLWLLFLFWLLASTIMLPANPPGTLPNTVSSRLLSVGFALAGYLAATVILLYAGNLTEREFPRRKLVRQLGFFFIVCLGGGLLGTFAPTFGFTSLVERLLPQRIASNGFVSSLVHPAASQLQDVLGFSSPRPSAPFGYTNTWGNCLALLIGWFVVAWLHKAGGPRRLVGLVLLALSAIPIVYSLNRGLWIGLGLIVAFMALRLAMRGHIALLGGVIVGLVLVGTLVAVSPLATIIQERFDNPKSNAIRAFTLDRTLEVFQYSPVLGFGGPRAALGSSNSIAIGADAKCPRCGNPTLGSNGQLWLLLIAQGAGGAALYVGFFLRSLWAYRRDPTPIGDAGLLALALPLFFMFVYNALTMPLVISFLSIALLWRNQRDEDVPEEPQALPAAITAVPVRVPGGRA
ncbi:MAG: O-antigen ligase family protein [Blastococcus sp.]